MKFLSDKIEFPSVASADSNGVIAVGGDLSIERLKLAYCKGIFPWYSEDQPVIWYSPDPRMVLFPEELKVSKSMRQFLRKSNLKVTCNKSFQAVIENCKKVDRTDQGEYDTWITDDMKQAYIDLHNVGIAKSIEVWEGEMLVGGLYGVEQGDVFCGESMFSLVSNASKVAFIYLVKHYEKRFKLIDCQVYNDHLASLGAREISREEFLSYL